MFGQVAPADRKDVSGLKRAPIVKGSAPAVKHDKDLLTSDLPHRGRTYEIRILPVHRFQLHARLEVVFGRRGWFLNVKTHKKRHISCGLFLGQHSATIAPNLKQIKKENNHNAKFVV